jgi:hypothetical protein
MFYRVDDTADWKFELVNDHWILFGPVSNQNRRVNKRLGWSIVHRSIKCVRFRNFRVGVELPTRYFHRNYSIEQIYMELGKSCKSRFWACRACRIYMGAR